MKKAMPKEELDGFDSEDVTVFFMLRARRVFYKLL